MKNTIALPILLFCCISLLAQNHELNIANTYKKPEAEIYEHKQNITIESKANLHWKPSQQNAFLTAIDSMEHYREVNDSMKLWYTTYYEYNLDYTMESASKFYWDSNQYFSKEAWKYNVPEASVVLYNLYYYRNNDGFDTAGYTYYHRNQNNLDTLIETYYKNGTSFILFELEELKYNAIGEKNYHRIRRYTNENEVEYDNLIEEKETHFYHRLRSLRNGELQYYTAYYADYNQDGKPTFSYDSIYNSSYDSVFLNNQWLGFYANGVLDHEYDYVYDFDTLALVVFTEYLDYNSNDWIKKRRYSARQDSLGVFQNASNIITLRAFDSLQREVKNVQFSALDTITGTDTSTVVFTSYSSGNNVDTITQVTYRGSVSDNELTSRIITKTGGTPNYEVVDSYRRNYNLDSVIFYGTEVTVSFENEDYLVMNYRPNVNYLEEYTYNDSETRNEIVAYPEYYRQHPFVLESYEMDRDAYHYFYKYYWSTRYFTSVDEQVSNDFTIYPNPANGYILMDVDDPSQTISVFDLTGKKVIEGQLDANRQLNISSLKNGVYLVKLVTNEAIQTAKFVKQ